MNDITSVFSVNFREIFIGVCIVALAFIAIVGIVEKISVIINKPVKWLREKNNDHRLLLRTAEKLDSAIKKHNDDITESSLQDSVIERKLEILTSMVLDKQLEDERWEIINFAARIADGGNCTKDAYQHVLRTYEKYEKLIEENGMTNGEAEISIDIIKASYREKLKNGLI